LLAIAIAFIMALCLRPVRDHANRRRALSAPPLRGPPLGLTLCPTTPVVAPCIAQILSEWGCDLPASRSWHAD